MGGAFAIAMFLAAISFAVTLSVIIPAAKKFAYQTIALALSVNALSCFVVVHLLAQAVWYNSMALYFIGMIFFLLGVHGVFSAIAFKTGLAQKIVEKMGGQLPRA